MKLLKLVACLLILALIGSCKQAGETEGPFILNVDLSEIGKEIPDRSMKDYHQDYGRIKADEYPVNPKGWDINSVLEDIGMKKEEMSAVCVLKKKYSGEFLVEHLMKDGKRIYVWHEYKDEPIIIVAGKTQKGSIKKPISVIIEKCSNCGGGMIHIGEGVSMLDFIMQCERYGINITYSY